MNMTPPKSNKSCFILMRLTIVSLPILLIASVFHAQTMFVICSEQMAKYIGPLLKKLRIEQLTEHKYYQDGTFYDGHKNAIVVGKRVVERHRNLANIFPISPLRIG
jgi:hypothetical protein